MTNTPGLGGYLLAWAVSVGAFALVLALWGVMSDGGSLGDAVSLCVLVVFFGFWYSIPFAALGMPVVHLVCRRVRRQWVHVVAAGVVGASPLLTFGLTSGEWTVLGVEFIPLATAIGRWSVVPLVEHRRRAATLLPTMVVVR